MKRRFFKALNEEGKEVVYEELFEFYSKDTNKNYIAYTDDSTDADGSTKVYASVFWGEIDKDYKVTAKDIEAAKKKFIEEEFDKASKVSEEEQFENYLEYMKNVCGENYKFGMPVTLKVAPIETDKEWATIEKYFNQITKVLQENNGSKED